MRFIPGYKGRYSATRDGRIYSHLSKKFLKPWIKNVGYKSIGLRKNGRKKTHSVHKLIALTYLKKSKSKIWVNHKNGIKTDNRVENLEWVTPQQNYDHGRDVLKVNCGEKNGQSKLTWFKVEQIREMIKKGVPVVNIAKIYGVHKRGIFNIKANKSWRV